MATQQIFFPIIPKKGSDWWPVWYNLQWLAQNYASGLPGPPGPTGPTGPPGPSGPSGPAGPTGAAGSMWYEGTTVPASGLGVNGDLYLRTTTGDVYQKASGAWSIVGNIMGPAGATGATGPAGPTGPMGPGTYPDTTGKLNDVLTVSTDGAAPTWQPTAPSGSTITYIGAYDNAHTYHDGDYVIGADGITYQCVKEGTVGVTPTPFGTSGYGVPTPVVNGQWVKGVSGIPVWSAIAPSDVGLPKITTSAFSAGPPASPANGDIWNATGVDGGGAVWTFAYNAGSSSAYKWEFIGGTPFTTIAGASGLINAGYAVSAPNWYSPGSGYNYTIARPGDYLLRDGVATVGSATVAAYALAGFFKNAAAPTLYAHVPFTAQGIAADASVTLPCPAWIFTGCVAGDVVGVAVATAANATITFSSLSFSLQPKRIS